jgi:hypothetical protein
VVVKIDPDIGSLFANLKDEDKVCIEETEEWRLPAGASSCDDSAPRGLH